MLVQSFTGRDEGVANPRTLAAVRRRKAAIDGDARVLLADNIVVRGRGTGNRG